MSFGQCFFALVLFSQHAQAFTFESAVSKGCHELLTADSIRFAGANNLGPADPALVDDLPFHVDTDMRDQGAIAALIGVRDNDLKGNDPLDLFELAQVHGNSHHQDEHCLRQSNDNEPNGTANAISRCRQYIRDTLVSALHAKGSTSLRVALSTRGTIDVSLPERYVRFGQAIHAFQDSFTHTFRTTSGKRVLTALNWVDSLDSNYDEARDGPPHLSILDRCEVTHPLVASRFAVAQEASRALAVAFFQGDLDETARLNHIDQILDEYLTVVPGCSYENSWCGAKENSLKRDEHSGCSSAFQSPDVFPKYSLAIFFLVLLLLVSRKRSVSWLTLAILLLIPQVSFAQQLPSVSSDSTPPKDPNEANPPSAQSPVSPTQPPSAPVASSPRFGAVLSGSAALDRPAIATALGARFRATSRWSFGVDGEWNPWFAVQIKEFRRGALNLYSTAIYSYNLPLNHLQFRTTAHLGTSILLYDLYGAPAGSTGVYLGMNFLGAAFDLGKSFKFIVDPADVAVAVPQLRGVPLVHKQYRFTIGFQWGA